MNEHKYLDATIRNAKISNATLARKMNCTPGFISQMRRGHAPINPEWALKLEINLLRFSAEKIKPGFFKNLRKIGWEKQGAKGKGDSPNDDKEVDAGHDNPSAGQGNGCDSADSPITGNVDQHAAWYLCN